jgi:CheY-like chemotaxis protein
MPHSDTLLLVDDNQPLVSIYARLLADCGFRVMTACSGREAVNLCQKGPGDVVLAIVDLKMPGLDGPATIAQLQGRCPQLKVIAVSGGMLSPYFGQLAFLGVRHFLPKPFGIDGLLESIAQVREFVANSAIAPRISSN